jgi:hypothetical protein
MDLNAQYNFSKLLPSEFSRYCEVGKLEIGQFDSLNGSVLVGRYTHAARVTKICYLNAKEKIKIKKKKRKSTTNKFQ